MILPNSSGYSYETRDNIKIIRCDGFWGLKSSKSPLGKYEMWIKYGDKALKKYIKDYGKPDVIHAHNMIYSGLLAVHIHQKYKIPIIITEHSSQYAMGKISKELMSKLVEGFSFDVPIYAVSPKLIELLENKFQILKNKIEWLPNVLDPLVEDEPINYKQSDSKIRFLNVANLIPLKGQMDLIDAFNKAFHDQFEKVELVIVGDGMLKNELIKRIEELNLSQNIKLLGYLSRKEVLKQMDNSDVFVLPSHYETFGVVLIEAMSRGVPLISTYCGGPECIIDESNGVLVEPKNVEQLAQALSKMSCNYKSYNNEELRQQALNSYGKENFYKKIMNIYSKNS